MLSANGVLDGTAETPVASARQDYGLGDESQNELARRAATGDESAYEELYRRFHARTHALCKRMVGESLAWDMNQECWIAVYRKLKSFRGDSKFSTWLHRIAVNACLMHFRKPTTRQELLAREEEEIPVIVVPGTERPERMSIVDRIAIDEAMQHLPQGYYDVLMLHDVQGFEHEEVAKILGMSVGTSKSQLHKARIRMQKLLKRKNMTGQERPFIEAGTDPRTGIELSSATVAEWENMQDMAAEIDLADDYEGFDGELEENDYE